MQHLSRIKAKSTISSIGKDGDYTQHQVLYCIVLNYYTGTPLSPVDYFPGSPVKVEHRIQDMKHKQTNKQTKKQ